MSSSWVQVMVIFVLMAAAMCGLAIAADLHHHSGVAVVILMLGVPAVMVIQISDMLDDRRIRRLRFPDGSKLPRARARYRDRDAQ